MTPRASRTAVWGLWAPHAPVGARSIASQIKSKELQKAVEQLTARLEADGHCSQFYAWRVFLNFTEDGAINGVVHSAKYGVPRGVGGGGAWHKALVVGSVSLWRRLLASRL